MEYLYDKQHKRGKLHAYERIQLLLDSESFHEIGKEISNYRSKEIYDPVSYDGVITGYGLINGRQVFIYSQDFTVMGGTLGKNHGKKIVRIMDLAIENHCPVIGILDSGGARIQEGVNALASYGEIFYKNTLASGYIPQISVIAGSCAGGAVYSPGITDFIFMIDGISNMFVTGPKVVKSVGGGAITQEELGGTEVHARKSGVAHFRMHSEKECFAKIRDLLNYLPHYYGDKTDKKDFLYQKSEIRKKNYTEICNILPKRNNVSYDMKKIISEIIDEETFMEIQEEFAQNIVIGFAKLCGITIGIVANQPGYLAGVLDCDASDKAARFIRYCDAFNIPLITLTDVPGFLPGVDQEYKGIIRHGAKLLYAYSEATTIKLNVIIRKAYGGAYIAMCSKHVGADFVYVWPNAEVAVLGAEAATEILYAKELKNMADCNREDYLKEKTEKYKMEYMNSKIALEEGYVDAILKPELTRERLYQDLCLLREKKSGFFLEKKHGNIPL